MTEAFVYDAIRTPRGRGKDTGSLHGTKPVSLVVGLLDELRKRNPGLDPARVEDVILGCVTPVGEQGADIARTAALAAGYETSGPGLPAQPVLRVRPGGGQHRRAEGALRLGGPDRRRRRRVDVAGADGLRRRRLGDGPGDGLRHQLRPAGRQRRPDRDHRGLQPRPTSTPYAAESQDARGQGASPTARSRRSVVPVRRPQRPGRARPRRVPARRARPSSRSPALKPSFAAIGEMGGFDAVALQKYHWVEKINHVHTPGNSSGIVDGAALVLIGSEQVGADLGLTPRARIVSVGVVGTEPTIMLTGPAPSARKALAKAGLTVDDIDLFEVNEAFAAVVLKFMKDLDVPHEKVNVNGGAIALGHPLGATGAMILGTLVDELERRDLRYGLATLCVGGGMGVATIVERI